jgi:heat shock protein HslJ
MKYIMSIGAIVVVGVSLVFIFNNSQKENSELENPPLVQNKEKQAIYGSWKWIQTTEYSQNIIKPKDSNQFVLTITKEGELSSTTDCNSITGSIVINEEVISIGTLASTKMFCMKETLESIYITDLQRAASYNIEGNILTINQIKDFGIMRFERVEKE